MDCPIFITCRDRVTDLRTLVAWLEQAGHQRIVLLDNDSTYEPLQNYYLQTPHKVIRLGENLGSRALWHAELVPDEWFVVTDPDIVPMDSCPLDAVTHLHDLAVRYDEPKVALGLHLDDLPPDMPSLAWERQLVAPDRQLEPGVFRSLSDTTFAMHAPNTAFRYEALRTGHPYQARHMPWYATELTAEDRYYLDRATPGPLGSSWAERTAA